MTAAFEKVSGQSAPLDGLQDLRQADPSLLERVVAQNQAVVELTSPLDVAALQALIEASLLALAEPETGSFLIAMGPEAAYDSANYLWLQQRFRRFAYGHLDF